MLSKSLKNIFSLPKKKKIVCHVICIKTIKKTKKNFVLINI